MSLSLTKPAIGSTGWGADVNENFTKIEAAVPPSGAIVMWPTETAPSGWLECNGDSVSKNDYADLYTAIGTRYGGDGNPNFNLPDLRGVFVRGFNNGKSSGYYDPDAASRDDRGDGETNGNTYVGTQQDEEFHAHTHSHNNGSSHNPVLGGSSWYRSNTLIQTGSSGGTETRPVNVALMFIIKT